MATDTLVILSQADDALCLDVVEPDRVPWRFFYRDHEELVTLLIEARRRGLSLRAAQAAYTDAFNAEMGFSPPTDYRLPPTDSPPASAPPADATWRYLAAAGAIWLGAVALGAWLAGVR